MIRDNPSSVDSRYPRVVGFDVPSGEENAGSGYSQVLLALLDVAPSPDWIEAFGANGNRFTAEHDLRELRLLVDKIALMGPAEILRKLPARVRALVHRVSRQCMQGRVTRMADVEPSAGGEQAMGAPASSAGPAPVRSVNTDVEAIGRIPGIATLLETVSRATGMRFAAVARVTDSRWTACAVYDLIEFNLLPGQDLVLESTICNEIRQHGNTVHFDQASTHPKFCTHATPAMYGFESYISVPIYYRNGTLFGTLCALDPEPAMLDEETIRTLEMFAGMIGLELEKIDAAESGPAVPLPA